MAYQVLAALGASENIVARCSKQVQAANLDTKAGREASVKTGARCAADGYCASYGLPPGVCGPVAESVAGEAIKLWNSIFGDDSAQRAWLKRRQEASEFFTALDKLFDLEQDMAAELRVVSGGLIDFHDRLNPWKKGAYGGAKPMQVGYRSKVTGEAISKGKGYEDDLPMRRLLVKHGLLIETKYLSEWDKQNAPIQRPKLFAHALYQSEPWAKSKRAELLAKCQPLVGPPKIACLATVPSVTTLETQYVASLEGIAIQFYDTLDKAILRARAELAAQATTERLLRQAKFAGIRAGVSLSAVKLGAAAIVAGGLLAAVIVYRRRKR